MAPTPGRVPTCRPGPALCRGAAATVVDLLPADPGVPHTEADVTAPDHLGRCPTCRAALIGCLRDGCAAPIDVMTQWLDQVRAAHFPVDGKGRHQEARQEALMLAWSLLTGHTHFDPATTVHDTDDATAYLAVAMQHQGRGYLADEARKDLGPGSGPTTRAPWDSVEEITDKGGDSVPMGPLVPSVGNDPETVVLARCGVAAIERTVDVLLPNAATRHGRVVRMWLHGRVDPAGALTQTEIGDRVGCGQPRVSTIVKDFKADLQAELDRQEADGA